jgi:hypothetical protein
MRTGTSACVALVAVAAFVAIEARAEETVVPRYEGQVGADTLCAFVEGFFDHLDGIVGIKARVEAVDDTVDGQARFAGESDGALLMYCVKDFDGLEVVVNGGTRSGQGAFGVDGFYRVTSGGTHQGTTSVGLTPVDEATALGSGGKVVAVPVP